MGKHVDLDGDGVADQGSPGDRSDREYGRDFDLGVPHVVGQYFHQLEQAPGLGRHVLHDARSLDHDAAQLVEHVTTEKTTTHKRYGEIFDQGDVGACTAMAALGLMNTEPFVGSKDLFITRDALNFYAAETHLDDAQIPGSYPPNDSGSTGLWSMKLLKLQRLIPGYRWAFSLATVKKLLQVSPISLGLPWFNSMFNVDRDGFLVVQPASGLAGGHQIEATGVDFERQAVLLANSWGTGWGKNGFAYLRFTHLDQLLKLHGDVSVPTGRL
jgi:hypothetical protein